MSEVTSIIYTNNLFGYATPLFLLIKHYLNFIHLVTSYECLRQKQINLNLILVP